jgi:Flp pilus assembly protein TadG
MASKLLSDKLTQALQGFGGAQSGNVILTFALAIVPLLGFVGAAVDYSRANSDKAAMQAAMDATALMLSKNVATLTTTQMNQKATDYFNTLFTRTDATNVVITPTYTNTAGSQIVLTGTGQVPTKFMNIMGFSYLPLNVSSTVKWGNRRLRVRWC